MKRLLSGIILLLCACVTQSHAQNYFHHLYGNTNTGPQIMYGSCLATMGGANSYGLTGSDNGRIYAVHPDNNGDLPNPQNFNKSFELTDQWGDIAGAYGRAITEYNNNGNPAYAIVGDFASRNVNGMFLLLLDDVGNRIAFYPLFIQNATTQSPVAIVYNPNTGKFVFTGYFLPSTGTIGDIFAIEMDVSGNITAGGQVDIMPNPLCSHATSDDKPHDIVLDPYNTGTNDYYIVGTCNNQYGNVMGFMLGLDPNLNPTGVTVYFSGSLVLPFYYVSGAADVELQSINTSAQNNGFIIGGRFNDQADDNFLVKLTDAAGTTAWNSVFDYTYSPGSNNTCMDVREDVNSSQFYAVGNVDAGYFGSGDIQAVRIDGSGNAIANGEFTYGSSSHEDAIGVETYNGLYFTGNRSSEHYMIHTAADGTGSCDDMIEDATQATPDIGEYFTNLQGFGLQINQDLYITIREYTLTDNTICSNPPPSPAAKPTGVNNITAKGMSVYPNPATGKFNIDVPPLRAGRVEIFDITGKRVYTQEITKNIVSIDASQWGNGIYLVKLLDNNQLIQTTKLVKMN